MPSASRLTCALFALTTACASHRRVVTMSSAGEVGTLGVPRTAPVIVRVRNAFAEPLTLYTLNEGVATRLGEIAAQRAADFTLTATQIPAAGITLLGVPATGDARATSGPLRMLPGDVVDFSIGATLADARATVRSP